MADQLIPKKRVPLGRPLRHTEKQLEELAKVTPADIERAQILWQKYAPRKYKNLLDAQPVENNGSTQSTNA
jgi:hypothetical protein